MTGFAGSRSLDERRRRRLATGSESVSVEQAADAAPRRSSLAKAKNKRRGPAHFPLRKIISSRYWKLCAVILCAALAAAGILVGGWAASLYGEQLGPGFVFLFRLDTARLVRGFAAVGLLLAGELALLISWARAQSLQDFNGRYRGWVFCALLGFLAAFGLQTQLAAAWSATATWLWATPFSHKATLLWLVPTVTGALFVHAYLVREMRDCRLSSIFAWLAALFGCGAAVVVLARPLPLSPTQGRMIECGVALLFVVCAFSSLLLHARHVLYVCADPPSSGPSRLAGLLRSIRPFGVLSKLTRSSGKKTVPAADRDAVTSLRRRTTKRARPARRKPAPPELEPSSEKKEPEVRVVAPSAPSRRSAASTPLTSSKKLPSIVNEEADDDAIDGSNQAAAVQSDTSGPNQNSTGSSPASNQFDRMSRRERRLLKKQMRTQSPLRRSA